MLTDWIPLLRDLRQYRPEWLSHDLIAGLSVAAVQVPTAIAYANHGGLPRRSRAVCQHVAGTDLWLCSAPRGN